MDLPLHLCRIVLSCYAQLATGPALYFRGNTGTTLLLLGCDEGARVESGAVDETPQAAASAAA